MDQLQKIEAKLDEIFREKVLYQLPAQSRKGVAEALWGITLAAGILQLWGAWLLWQAGERANQVVDTANYLSRLYGSGDAVESLGPFFYISVLMAVATGILLLLAVPGLKDMNKTRGWDILFYGALINILYGMVRMFSDVSGGFGNLLLAVMVSCLGLFLLFQVRTYFSTSHVIPGHKLKKKPVDDIESPK